MKEPQTNTENLFKQKFEGFVAVPPEHVWSGIQAGIVKPSFFALYWKALSAAAVAIFITAGIIYFTVDKDQNSIETEKNVAIDDSTNSEEQLILQSKKICPW